MNKNVLIVLAGGLLIALVVAMVVKAGLSDKKSDGIQIMVAARNLNVGYDLKPADVKWQTWPKESATIGMIVRKDDKQNLTEVAKGQLRRDIGNGEPILEASLDPGMRAVAIRVKAESMVGGFIAPDDRVDVIMTYEVKGDEMDNPEVRQEVRKYATETILENVRVLAIDQQARRDDDKAKVGRTVTLEVDGAGAERLNLASTMAEGGLTLSLRAIGDDTIMSKTRHNLTTDTEISSVLQRINRISDGSPQGPSNVVRVYNGEDVQNMVVRSAGPLTPVAPDTQEAAP